MKSLWNVTLHFGSSVVPAKLYNATQKTSPDFVQIDTRDNARVRLSRLNSTSAEEIDGAYLGRAYEHDKVLYPVTNEFINSYKPELSSELVFDDFVDRSSVHPAYFENFYYLHPVDDFESEYQSLYSVVDNASSIGLCQTFFRNVSHLFALNTFRGSLVLHKLKFEAQLVEPEYTSTVPDTSVKAVKDALNSHIVTSLIEFNPSQYKDSYSENLVGAMLSKLRPAA